MLRSPFVLKIAMLGTVLMYFPLAEAVGRETPKLTFTEYFLPGVTRWDSIPFHDFRRVWWVALCAALGNISQEGWSLLQTARNQDLGAPGNPGTPGQQVQSENRNQRLFGAILNYIEANTWLYHYVSSTFQNNGRGLFEYLWVYGHLPYTVDQIDMMEHEWTDATMHRVGIAYNNEAPFKWLDWVTQHASKLNKTPTQIRSKYLQGFPSSFDVIIVAERHRGPIGSYIYPANYAAHHPLAGQPHPHAGQPDIMSMARAFYPEWARMIKTGLIRAVPRGMANNLDDRPRRSYDRYSRPRTYQTHDDSDSDEQVNMAKSSVNDKTVCGICGGIGHAGKVDGIGQCLTARLNHRIPHADLGAIKYPEGYKPPTFMHKPRSVRFVGGEPSTSQEGDEFQTSNDLTSNHASQVRSSSRPRTHTRTKFYPKRKFNKARATEDDTSQETSQNSAAAAAPANDSSDTGDENDALAVQVDHMIFD